MRLIGLGLLALSLTLPPLATEVQQTGKVYRISFLALLPSEDAKAIGLTIPQSLLVRADQVIK
jgi:hypothetical protein